MILEPRDHWNTVDAVLENDAQIGTDKEASLGKVNGFLVRPSVPQLRAVKCYGAHFLSAILSSHPLLFSYPPITLISLNLSPSDYY